MRWEDEHYVKLYTRDSLTWKSWGWQARTVFVHLIRKVDGAGILQCEGFDPTEAAALMLDLPREVVEPGLSQLAKSGTIEIGPGVVIVSKFVEAQEARKTDKLRKRDQRTRDRDKARAQGVENTEVSHAVTRGHTVSHEPQPRDADRDIGHAESRDVTRGHPPSSSSSPTPSPSSEESLSSADAAEAPPGEVLELELDDVQRQPVEEVLSHYVEAMRANGVTVRDTKSKRDLIRKALKSNSVEDLKQAINGLTWSDWHMGRDPKSNGESWTGLEYAIGSAERIEKNLQRAASPPQRERLVRL